MEDQYMMSLSPVAMNIARWYQPSLGDQDITTRRTKDGQWTDRHRQSLRNRLLMWASDKTSRCDTQHPRLLSTVVRWYYK